jgi:single-strand DNA-binding protein
MNVSVVKGHLSRTPQERTLPSGDRIVTLEVSVRRAEEATESVPVAWPNPPRNAAELAPGTQVLVLGRIRRRFFRAGGFTQSRTELVAESVVPVRQPKRVEGLLATAVERLTQ